MALAIGVHLALELPLPEVRFVAVDVLRRDIIGEMVIADRCWRVAVSMGFVARLPTRLAGPDGSSPWMSSGETSSGSPPAPDRGRKNGAGGGMLARWAPDC
jgi:hypothetical protein